MKCRKETDSKNSRVANISAEKLMILSKRAVCNSKKIKIMEEQKASELLSGWRINTPFSRILLVGPTLF